MRVQLAKTRREVAMLDWRNVLVFEENDLVFEECSANVGDLLIVQSLRQIDAFNDATNVRRQYLNLEFCHRQAPACAIQAHCAARDQLLALGGWTG
jgi:hypothetical protein